MEELQEHPIYDPSEEEDGCYECGGDGWITEDCFEDTCCCSDPEIEHGVVPCPLCNLKGSK